MSTEFLIFCGSLSTGYTLKIPGRDGVRSFQQLEEAVATARLEAGIEGARLIILDATGNTAVNIAI